jgi:hypothetical protein
VRGREETDGRAAFLAKHSGWLLILWGVALVVLACLFADQATVAPIFAFTGVASFVLGALAARFEGDFELSATRLKGKLRSLAASEELTLEEKGDELQRLVGATGPRQLEPSEGESLSADFRSLDPRGRAEAFEAAAEAWFHRHGWAVHRLAADFGYDFTVERDSSTWLVEAKARTRLTAADVRELAGRAEALRTIDQMPDLPIMYAIPLGSLTAAAREAAARLPTYVCFTEIPT